MAEHKLYVCSVLFSWAMDKATELTQYHSPRITIAGHSDKLKKSKYVTW